MKPTRTITPDMAERMYQHYRVHVLKEYQKGKSPLEIQNLRRKLFAKYLMENGIEIEPNRE